MTFDKEEKKVLNFMDNKKHDLIQLGTIKCGTVLLFNYFLILNQIRFCVCYIAISKRQKSSSQGD